MQFPSFSEEDIRFKHVRGVLHDVEYHQASETECRVLHHICQLASVRAATLASVGMFVHAFIYMHFYLSFIYLNVNFTGTVSLYQNLAGLR